MHSTEILWIVDVDLIRLNMEADVVQITLPAEVRSGSSKEIFIDVFADHWINMIADKIQQLNTHGWTLNKKIQTTHFYVPSEVGDLNPCWCGNLIICWIGNRN